MSNSTFITWTAPTRATTRAVASSTSRIIIRTTISGTTRSRTRSRASKISQRHQLLIKFSEVTAKWRPYFMWFLITIIYTLPRTSESLLWRFVSWFLHHQSLTHSLTVAATNFHKCMWGTGLLCSAFYFSLLSDAISTTAEELQQFACLLCYTNPEWSPHVPRPAVWGLFRVSQTLTKEHFIQLTT